MANKDIRVQFKRCVGLPGLLDDEFTVSTIYFVHYFCAVDIGGDGKYMFYMYTSL